MSKDDLAVLPLILLLLLPAIATLWLSPKHIIVRYNCDIAEISPDIPIKVKEECRKLKSGRI
jgi:hypothetical protein